MFVKNAWYVAAQSQELGADRPLGRRICDLPMVFYRGVQGQVAALEDFCPHRGAPLSLGTVRDGHLVCGYHGLAVGSDGQPAHMPCQRLKVIPAVPSYPVIERDGFVWVWPGEAALADPALLPVPVWRDQPDWAFGGGLYHMACDYRLLVDNLMDLTHETYVHANSIGQKEIDEAPVSTRVEGDEVVTERYMSDIQAPPFWQAALQAQGLDPLARVDRWQICRFVPPSNVLIDVGVALQGRGGFDAPLADKAAAVVVDFITPETATSCWYFWGMARHFKADDAALTQAIQEGQGRIFAEDMEILARQQQNLLAWPGRRLLTLNIDAGGAHARRVIERRLQAESA